MATCPGHGHSRRACSITGAGGAALATGDVVTAEAALRAVSMQNGLARVTYELPTSANKAGCHLFINGGHTADGHEDDWTRCFDSTEADWSFWVVPPTTTADRIVVLKATDDECEMSIEWTTYALNTGYLDGDPELDGLVSRDYARNAIFPSSSAVARRITEVHLRKRILMKRGVQGYWVAWDSAPNVVPMITAVGQAANNELNLGERELGTGGGSRVVWTSAGKVCYSPAWRSQRDWSAYATAFPSQDTYTCWLGSDDPTSPSKFSDATFVAMQFAGFPAEAAAGGFYIGDLYPTTNVVRVLVQKNPNQIGVWHYDGQNGQVVNHLTNPWTEADGRLTRYPLFFGADHYTADSTAVAVSGYTGTVAYGNEPTVTAQALVAAIAEAAIEEWPT